MPPTRGSRIGGFLPCFCICMTFHTKCYAERVLLGGLVGENLVKAGRRVAANSFKRALTKLGLRKARPSDNVQRPVVRRPSETVDLAQLSSQQKLVFLAGPPRSGTTWLNREICNHPGWSGFLPECTLLTQQIALYRSTNASASRRGSRPMSVTSKI